MQIKETKILLDDFLLFLSIFCKKQNSEKMDEKNRQTAAIITVDLNPEFLQYWEENIVQLQFCQDFTDLISV